MNSSLILPSDGTSVQLAATIWQRVTELCDQHLNLDLSERTKIETGDENPAFSYVDCEAPFPELSPGVAALRHRISHLGGTCFYAGMPFRRIIRPDRQRLSQV